MVLVSAGVLFFALNCKLMVHYLSANDPESMRRAELHMSFIRHHAALHATDTYAAAAPDSDPDSDPDPDPDLCASRRLAVLDGLRVRLVSAPGFNDATLRDTLCVYEHCAEAVLRDCAAGENAFA
jgi:hypothetical protein